MFAHVDEIARFIGRKGTTAVFCDGGDKRKELQAFTPCLKIDDVIAVHDWGWAVSYEDKRGLPLQKLEQSKIDPLTAFFRKIAP